MTNSPVAGYILYAGNASGDYLYSVDVGTNTIITVNSLAWGTNYYFAVTSYDAGGLESSYSSEITVVARAPDFFNAQIPLGGGLEYLQFPDGDGFGFYNLQYFPWIYHYDMGFEYFIDASDGQGGGYFYDFTSRTFWYTSTTLFPYLYDFTLNSWIFYYVDTKNPGHFTSNPRYFYNFKDGAIITK